MVDYLYEAHQQKELYQQRNEADKRVIFRLLVQRRFLFRNPVLIAEVLCLDLQQRRRHLYQSYGILMQADGNRQ